MQQFYTHDLSRAFDKPTLAAKKDSLNVSVQRAVRRLRGEVSKGVLPALHITGESQDLAGIEAAAAFFRGFRTVYIMGTGGSSLGGQMLAHMGRGAYGAHSPALVFLDNIDPHSWEQLLAVLDWPQAGFLFISKSGGTAETLAQFLALQAAAPQGYRFASHSRVITENTDNPLRTQAQNLGIETIDHNPGIGGRYAVFSAVALIPAALADLDIKALRRGAAAALAASLKDEASYASDGALLNLAAIKTGLNGTVLMPYVDRLYYLSFWFRQLWAESIGKQGLGSTPINAQGTVDQHSQLQLYCAGPNDKLFTVITSAAAGLGSSIGHSTDARLEYLQGHTLGDLLAAEQQATIDSLASHGRAVRHIHISAFDAESLGALLMQLVLETILVCYALDVDPFDQPAVEDGKRRARDYLKALRSR